MTIWHRIRVTRFSYELQGYVSPLLHRYISARTEFKKGILTIYLMETELDLIRGLTFTLDQIKLAQKSRAYRNEIMVEIRNEISLAIQKLKSLITLTPNLSVFLI